MLLKVGFGGVQPPLFLHPSAIVHNNFHLKFDGKGREDAIFHLPCMMQFTIFF
jgi:hypothetical protein